MFSGFWPRGRVARVYNDGIESDVQSAVETLSRRWFGHVADEMAQEQIAWMKSLRRPVYDARAVPLSLETAIRARLVKSQFALRRFGCLDDVTEARNAFVNRSESTAWEADTEWDSWSGAAWMEWEDKDRESAWEAADAWAGEDRASLECLPAWHAWDALLVSHARLRGWTTQPDLSVGLRDAYRYGLEVAIPTGRNELGWTMAVTV